MKKLILFFIITTFFLSGKMFAQGMTPPAPIDAPVFSTLSGTWTSEPYQMMGSTMTDEATQNMVLNGQYLEVNIRSTGSSGFIYEAKVMISPLADGTLTGWAFDIFGKEGLTNYTGTWKGNMIYLYGTAPWGTESRVINVDGNVMIHNIIYKMKDANGKTLPDETLAITYNKKM